MQLKAYITLKMISVACCHYGFLSACCVILLTQCQKKWKDPSDICGVVKQILMLLEETHIWHTHQMLRFFPLLSSRLIHSPSVVFSLLPSLTFSPPPTPACIHIQTAQ